MALSVAACSCSRDDTQATHLREAAAKASAPKIAVDQASYDFGVVRQGEPREHGFKLTNTGSALLTIEEIVATCACTVFEIEQKQLAPGASTWLKVRYRPTSRTGADHQTIRVRSNDPKQQWLELAIEAVVPPDIRFEPASLRLTADPKPNEAVCQLEGTAVLRANLHLAEVRGEPAAVAALTVTVSSAPYGREHRPEVRAVLKRRASVPGRVVAVVLTGLPDPTQILVPIEWGQKPNDANGAVESAR